MFTTADYNRLETALLRAAMNTAQKLGKAHPMTKMLGSLAWGRHGAEAGPSGSQLRPALHAVSFVEGYLACVILWARDADSGAQRVLLDEIGRERSKAVQP